MVEVHSAWFQPDSQETRERMRVQTNPSLDPIQYSKLEHQGVITDAQFRDNVVIPSVDRVWLASTYMDDETAYIYNSKVWRFTLGAAGPGVEASYEVDLVAVGAATHLQDPWVGDLLTDLQNDIIAQVLAGTHPGVPAGLMSFSVEFETDDDLYPGTVAGRSVEITSAELESHEYNRDGSDKYPGVDINLGEFDPIYGLAIPRSASDPDDDPDAGDFADPDIFGAISYSTTGDTTGTDVPPDAWYSPTLEQRATTVSPGSNVASGVEVLGTVHVDDSAVWPVDDAWWEANKWTITRFGSDVNYGVPVMLTPEWLVLSALTLAPPDSPYGDEKHTTGRASATIYMNAVWTPPRYRIIYDVDSTVIPPRRIFGRSDGATHGARRALGGGNTRQSGSRTLGSIL